jgi:hypothetical protein
MRDGLPINDRSFVNVPYRYTVNARYDALTAGNFADINFSYDRALPTDKAMCPLMSAGSSYIAFF